MAQKNLYLRDADTPIWKAAERVAERNRVSVSRLVIDALRDYLPRAAAQPMHEVRWDDLGADVPAA